MITLPSTLTTVDQQHGYRSRGCVTLLPGVRAGRIGNDMASNKRRRHTPDQIIRKLAEGNKLLAGGQELDEVCRHLQIAESTWHRWLAQYGGMKADDAKRLKELEAENARLKRLVANQALDIDMLSEISAGNF
jgi:putative transposase